MPLPTAEQSARSDGFLVTGTDTDEYGVKMQMEIEFTDKL